VLPDFFPGSWLCEVTSPKIPLKPFGYSVHKLTTAGTRAAAKPAPRCLRKEPSRHWDHATVETVIGLIWIPRWNH